jgi:hypothetical protein
VTGRRGKRRRQLLSVVKVTIGYWEFKEEALCCRLWKTFFGRGCARVLRQNTGRMYSYITCDGETGFEIMYSRIWFTTFINSVL